MREDGVRTLYSVLNVDEGASLKEIRASYLELAKLHHPDKSLQGQAGRATGLEGTNNDAAGTLVNLSAASAAQGAAIDIVELNKAYETLSSPDRRASYDAQLQKQREAALHTRKPRVAGELELDAFEILSANGKPLRDDHDQSEQHEDGAEQGIMFRHPCRCGSTFIITQEELERGTELVACQGCSEVMRILL